MRRSGATLQRLEQFAHERVRKSPGRRDGVETLADLGDADAFHEDARPQFSGSALRW